MAFIDSALLAPLSGSEPYGQDLEQCADNDYVSFFNDAHFALPEKFFGPDGPFNPASDRDFQQNVAQLPRRLEALLRRTCDLRLFVFIAKLALLRRDIEEFSSALAATTALLDEHWTGVHPRAEDGSYFARVRALEELAQSVVTFSLQFAPICKDRRRGDISLRSKIAPAKEGEPPLTEPQIVQALQAADAEAIAVKRAAFERAAAALSRIREICVLQTAGAETPNFGKLSEHLAEILKLFGLAFPQEGELASVTEGDASTAAGPAAGAIARAADARAALDCAIDYFVRREPSSPVLPLIAQARQLYGKTFIEALAILVPEYVSRATFPIGDRHYFAISIPELAASTPSCDAYFADLETDEDSQPAPNNDAWRTAGAPIDASAAIQDGFVPSAVSEASGSEGAPVVENGGLAAPAEAFPPQGDMSQTPPSQNFHSETPRLEGRPVFSASTRAQALALLRDIATYVRTAEPTSPIPWLIDRACALAEKDFLSILSSVLPRNALSQRDSD